MNKHHQKNNGSVSLGLIFGLGILGLGIATTSLIFSTNSITSQTMSASGIRTLVTSDSATREGIYRVIESVSGQTVSFTNGNIPLLNNTDHASVLVSGTWPILTVASSANNNRITRNIITEINLFPSAFAFDQAVYTHGELNLSGNVTIAGNVYATNGIDIQGAAAKIIGDAYSPHSVNPFNNNSISGDVNDNHIQIDPPIIDTTTYYSTAVANGTYFSSTDSMNAVNNIKNNTVTGTYFIDDSINITGNNTDFSGTIIVTGDLTLNGGTFKTNTSNTNPLVLYVDGNLLLTGGVEISGIIFVAGETTLGNGTPKVNGSLISANNLNKATGGGNVLITYNSTYANAWQDIIGLDTESGTAPIVKNWHEI